VWVVDGQWRPERLATVVPEQRGTIEAGRTIELKKLPAHLPEHVLLYVGQTDLIPYRIEYLRRGRIEQQSRAGGAAARLSRDGHDRVLRHSHECADRPTEFVYQPSGLTQSKGLKVIDATDAYLKSLGTEGTK